MGTVHPQGPRPPPRTAPDPGSVATMRLVLCSLLVVLTVTLPARFAGAEPVPGPSREGAWPLLPRPEVASSFDPPVTPWGAGHRGVDLVGRRGQAVRTALAGTVTFAGPLAGRGVVVVRHGGVRTTYEPVSAGVRVGDHLARGARIGTLQRGTSHCFPQACLHWGLVRGRTYLDPLMLVGAGPVRLLPLVDPGSVGLDLLAWAVPAPSGSRVTSPTPGPAPVRPAGARAGRPGAADPR